MLLSELDQDELNTAAHTGSQIPPPEPAYSEDLTADVHAIDASWGVDLPGGAQPRWKCVCGQTFGRRQELGRHLAPWKMCLLKPCTYTWKRTEKIKAHIINDHASEFCQKVLEKIGKLRGNALIKLLDAYEFEVPDACSLDLPPLPELSGEYGKYCLRSVSSGLRTSEWFD